MEGFRPATVAELADIVTHAAETGGTLDLQGGGSKAAIGAPRTGATIVDMRSFAGIVDYDPAELVLTAGAGTPLCDIQDLVRGEGQMLAFEPFDYGPIFGQDEGASTIGGIVCAGIAGSSRLTRGAARDHLLGFAAVSGRGEPFVAGAKVVKNVTGYDLPKLATGSWGRLFAITEVTLKVLPSPRESLTRVISGLSPAAAYAVMARTLGSQAELSAAAYMPAGSAASVTLLRLEGFGPSVAARSTMLDRLFGTDAVLETLDVDTADTLWRGFRTLSPLEGTKPLWRIGIPARAFPAVAEALAASGSSWLADWGGGLIWASCADEPGAVRRMAAGAGGHAMLVRADPDFRSLTPAFHPRSAGVAALEARVRRAFDPAGVFETGRFMERVVAD
jgi:glycolate oxidase FAD binding subunit